MQMQTAIKRKADIDVVKWPNSLCYGHSLGYCFQRRYGFIWLFLYEFMIKRTMGCRLGIDIVLVLPCPHLFERLFLFMEIMEELMADTAVAAKRILVIEDRPQLNRFLAQLLEHLGYGVATARDGQEGVELFQTRGFDLVITDVFMPNKNGLQVIREIVADFPDARFIAMSGAESHEDPLAEARRAGAQHTFHKPFDTEELLQVIQEEIGRP